MTVTAATRTARAALAGMELTAGVRSVHSRKSPQGVITTIVNTRTENAARTEAIRITLAALDGATAVTVHPGFIAVTR